MSLLGIELNTAIPNKILGVVTAEPLERMGLLLAMTEVQPHEQFVSQEYRAGCG